MKEKGKPVMKRRSTNTVRSIKLIKNAERKNRGRKIAVELAVNPNKWSSAVRAWVVDSQERDRSETLPAFDSLFKDALPSSSQEQNPGSVNERKI
jgi:hypothetical protein